MTTIAIRAASTVGDIEAAQALFDDPPHLPSIQRFLDEPTHHLLLAYQDGVNEPIGFVSGVEMTHPDKGTEMFIYELAVHESYRQQGRSHCTAQRTSRDRAGPRLLRHVGPV